MKNGASKIILVIILLLAVALGGAAYCYLKTDLFKTPDQLFRKYLADYAESIDNFNYKPIDTMLSRMENESYESNVYIELKGGDELGVDANIELKAEHDAGTENSLATLSGKLNSGDQKFVTEGNMFLNKKKVGIKVEEAYDKYLVIENRDLKKLAKLFGMSEEDVKDIPDEIPETDYAANKEKVKQLTTKYSNRIFEEIGKDKYTVEKNVTTSIDGTEATTNKYSLTLSGKEFCTIIVKIMRELADDPDFVSLFTNEDAIKDFKDIIDDMEKDLDEVTEDTITISVYAANGKTVKVDMISKDANAFFVVTKNDSEDKMIYSISTDSANVDFVLTNNFADGKGKLKLAVNEDSKEGEIIINTTDNGDKIEFELDYDIAQLNDYKNYFSIKSDIKFDSGINIEDLDDNVEVLNDYKEEDLEKLATAIGEKLAKLEENEDGSYSLLPALFQAYALNSSSRSQLDFSSPSSDEDLESQGALTTPDSDDVTFDAEKLQVEEDIEAGIRLLLSEYHIDVLSDENANPADYLTQEKIAEKCEDMDIEVVDSTTIKCTTENNHVYFVTIDIDGENWSLNSATAEYSETGER